MSSHRDKTKPKSIYGYGTGPGKTDKRKSRQKARKAGGPKRFRQKGDMRPGHQHLGTGQKKKSARKR